MKVLLTSGGTKIPIDKVRHIGNMSKGTFPTKIAIEGMTEHKWHLNFLYSEGSKAPHLLEADILKSTAGEIAHNAEKLRHNIRISGGYLCPTYKDFDSYVTQLHSQLDNFDPDVVVLASAVSDYGTVPVDGKIRTGNALNIELYPLPKIIRTIKEKKPNVLLVGFKLLVNSTDGELIDAAMDSINKNGCDLVVANDLRDIKNNKHRVLLVTKNGVQIHDENIDKVVAKAITELKK